VSVASEPVDEQLEASESADEDAPIPARPAVVELAAAILITSGVLGLVGAIGAASDLPAGTELILLLTAALNVGSIAIGLLIRMGRGWLVAVNYVAVLGFLDFTGAPASGLALLLGIADVLVVIILLVQKPWFEAVRSARQLEKTRRVPSPPVGGG
jgi:hypothetical protein